MDHDVRKHALAKKIEAAGWGLFFIWIGVAYLAALGWGAALLGIGVIVIGAQIARRSFDLSMSGFTLFVGAMFLVGGAWELLGQAAPAPLVPILSIVAGALLVVFALARRHPAGRAA